MVEAVVAMEAAAIIVGRWGTWLRNAAWLEDEVVVEGATTVVKWVIWRGIAITVEVGEGMLMIEVVVEVVIIVERLAIWRGIVVMAEVLGGGMCMIEVVVVE